jgi:hypothetical protein
MTLRSFDKRMRFLAIATNMGHDCVRVNSWYIYNLTKQEKKDMPIDDLLDLLSEEIPLPYKVQMSEHLGSYNRDEGYNGHFVIVHLCALPDGAIIAVHPDGWYTWDDRR